MLQDARANVTSCGQRKLVDIIELARRLYHGIGITGIANTQGSIHAETVLSLTPLSIDFNIRYAKVKYASASKGIPTWREN